MEMVENGGNCGNGGNGDPFPKWWKWWKMVDNGGKMVETLKLLSVSGPPLSVFIGLMIFLLRWTRNTPKFPQRASRAGYASAASDPKYLIFRGALRAPDCEMLTPCLREPLRGRLKHRTV